MQQLDCNWTWFGESAGLPLQPQQIIALLHPENSCTAPETDDRSSDAADQINRLANQQPMHPAPQIWLWCLQDQMKMIAHQAIGMHLPSSLETSLTQGPHKLHPIRVLVENRFAPVAPAHHVITRSGVFDMQRSWHASDCYRSAAVVSIVSSDPFFPSQIRTGLPSSLRYSCPGPHRHLRLHRNLLQPHQTPLQP